MSAVPGWCFAPRIIALAVAAAVHTACGAGWPIASDDLKPDPLWHWGRLDNGLRYVVRCNPLPAGRVSYRFVAEVGGMHEATDETGFSHFVEHMAFNGTRDFKGESLGHELARHGIAAGPESSAFTFLTHTIYQFDAPGNTSGDIDWMLTVIRDIADGIEFEPEQVKRERGVILSEARERDTVERRFDSARRAEIYPGSPIGVEFSINPGSASPSALKKFYHKWYRADRMILVVVGDADTDAMEAAIRRKFSDLPAPDGPAPDVNPGPIGNPKEWTCRVFHDPEATGLHLEIVSVLPRDQPDTREERRTFLAAQFATFILNQRLAEDVRAAPASFSGASARIFAPTRFAFETSIQIQTAPVYMPNAVEVLDRELRQSFQFAFNPEEIALVKERYLRDVENGFKASASAQSPELASSVMQDAVWGIVSVSPEQALEFAREVTPRIDAVKINTSWRSMWQERRERIIGFGNYPVRERDDIVRHEFEARLSNPVRNHAEPAKIEFPYTNFGEPGELKQRRHLAEIDMDLLEFANGVKVNLKRTDFDANEVHVFMRIGGGVQNEPPGATGLAHLAAASLVAGGLGKLTQDELSRFYAVEPLSLQFNAAESDFEFTGTSAPNLEEHLLDLMCAYLTDPRWDRSAFTSAAGMLSSSYLEHAKTAEGMLGLKAMSFLANGDSRYREHSPEEIGRIGLYDVKTWLGPILRTAPIEVGIVGDFQTEELLPILARTLGALPARDKEPPTEHPVTFRTEPGKFALKVDRKSPRAATEVAWPAGGNLDVRTRRQLEVVGEIVRNRILQRVREDTGASYSPYATYWKSDAGDEPGYIMLWVMTAPRGRAKIEKLILREADDLARNGVGEDEFRQAIKPLTERTRSQLRSNAYWLKHIAPCAQSKPDVVNWPFTRTSDFETTTKEDINALMRAILPSKKAIKVTVAP